ncbi:hypothetical protein [Aerosakkonema funiforme]|uniref:hypothetical protein n=1 Tax=Aerosakkonema funiforme TaxID=1246630 RepID=UPI0035B9A9AE
MPRFTKICLSQQNQFRILLVLSAFLLSRSISTVAQQVPPSLTQGSSEFASAAIVHLPLPQR